MMDIPNSILSCLCGPPVPNRISLPAEAPARSSPYARGLVEKQAPTATPPLTIPSAAAARKIAPASPPSADQLTADIIAILRTASRPGPYLDLRLESAVGAAGWSEWLAERVLKALQAVIEQGREKMGGAMAEAHDAATRTAPEYFSKLWDFAKEHPAESTAAAVVLALVAFGVLVLLAPVVLETLGFAELGPVEGSFAAWWQATYEGYVPARSLFAYFQRLGMIWGRA